MIVTCEQCSRRFHLDDNRISASGSKVRCSKCKHVFKVYRQIDPIVSETVEPLVTSPPSQEPTSIADTSLFDAVRLDEIPLHTATESRIQPSDDSVGIVVSPMEGSTLEPSILAMDTGIPESQPSTPPESELTPISFEDIDLSLHASHKEVAASEDSDASTSKSLEDIDLDLEFLTLEKDTGKDQPAVTSASTLNLDGLTLDDLDSLASTSQPKEEAQRSSRIETPEAEPSAFVDEIYVEDVPTTNAAVEPAAPASQGQDRRVSKTAKSDTITFDDIEALDLDEIERLIENNQMGLNAGERTQEEVAFSRDLPSGPGRPIDSEGPADHPIRVAAAAIAHQQAAFTETAILDPSTLSVGSQLPDTGETQEREKRDIVSKKPVNKTLIALLCLVILGGAGYLALPFLSSLPIPFLASQPQEPEDVVGNRKIRIFDVNSKFMDTAGAGRLFIITGKIRNDYTEARGFVSVKGKLYDAAKKEVQSQTVFCGNLLSDGDLNTMQVEAIQKALSHRLGKDRANARIEPGGSIPFMMVFSQLPDQLDEFSLEVIGSAKIS